jgi:hypothetical protein
MKSIGKARSSLFPAVIVVGIGLVSRYQAVTKDRELKRQFVERYEVDEKLAPLLAIGTQQGIRMSPRLTSTNLPSWAKRSEGLWTIQEASWFGGTRIVVYRPSDGKWDESPTH